MMMHPRGNEIEALIEKLGPQLDGAPIAVCLPALIALCLMGLDDAVKQGAMSQEGLEINVERIIKAIRQAVHKHAATRREQ